MKVIVPLVGVLALMNIFPEQGADTKQKEFRTYQVAGTGWQTCGDWKNSSTDFKAGYVKGHVEANAQVAQVLSDIQEASKVKESFDPPPELKTRDYVEAIDKLCGDPYNTKIAVTNAVGFAVLTLSGGPAPDERVLGLLRCLGAAGTDRDRVRQCYNH